LVDLPNEKVMCHHTGFKQNCRELVCSGKCNRWIQIQGYDANTGVQINESNCIDNWTPRLLVENSRQTRSNAAAIENLTTEVDRAHQEDMVMRSKEVLDALAGHPRLVRPGCDAAQLESVSPKLIEQ